MAKLTPELIDREKQVRSFIEKYSDLFDLDPNLIRGLITQESRFVAEATSPTGCYGYGQFSHIGAKQVQNIAAMTDKASDLANFVKSEAANPDRGVKAICATLWWLFNRKYQQVLDKKLQLEAVLTFYNSGGRPAALVIQHGGHAEALEFIKALPKNIRSQSATYAPEVAAWFIAWHEYMAEEAAKNKPAPTPTPKPDNPFDDQVVGLDPRYRALVEALRLVEQSDPAVDIIVNVQDGLTEVTLILPGELN